MSRATPSCGTERSPSSAASWKTSVLADGLAPVLVVGADALVAVVAVHEHQVESGSGRGDAARVGDGELDPLVEPVAGERGTQLTVGFRTRRRLDVEVV